MRRGRAGAWSSGSSGPRPRCGAGRWWVSTRCSPGGRPPASGTSRIALTTLTLAVTACGGGDDNLEQGELVSKANAVCKEYEPKIAAVPQPAAAGGSSGENGTEAERITCFGKLASVLEDFAGRLDELEAADEVQDDWNALTSAFSDSAAATKRLVDQAKETDTAGGKKTADELNTLDARATAAAKKLGLEDCGD